MEAQRGYSGLVERSHATNRDTPEPLYCMLKRYCECVYLLADQLEKQLENESLKKHHHNFLISISD